MSMLSPKLQLRVSQKQILTPGLVQMVTVLQLNRLELKEMITQEIVKNPVLEESAEDPGEDISAEELLPLLEPERLADTADREILDATVMNASSALDGGLADVAINGSVGVCRIRIRRGTGGSHCAGSAARNHPFHRPV